MLSTHINNMQYKLDRANDVTALKQRIAELESREIEL